MNTENHFQTAAFICSVADLLRGELKQCLYGRVRLPLFPYSNLDDQDALAIVS